MKPHPTAPARIDQILPSFARRDAIGSCAAEIQNILRDEGFVSEIFAEHWTKETEELCHSSYDYKAFDNAQNILIYHYSVGSNIPLILPYLSAFCVTYYHNITPSHFFSQPEQSEARYACERGRRQMSLVRGRTDHVWSVSQFNAEDLRVNGFEDPKIVPIARDYSRLTNLSDDPAVSGLLSDDRKNLLFVGRIMPNKAQHDLIQFLKLYQEHFDPKVRLILVGGASPGYRSNLLNLCEQLDLSVSKGMRPILPPKRADVIFTDSVDDRTMATLYRNSHAFVSMSEHEGFCVPLVEAMNFGLPILAHRAAAIPETSRDSAILVDKTDIVSTLGALHSILSNNRVAEELSERSIARSKDFRIDAIRSVIRERVRDAVDAFEAKRLSSYGWDNSSDFHQQPAK